jgi:hypothetical protein
MIVEHDANERRVAHRLARCLADDGAPLPIRFGASRQHGRSRSKSKLTRQRDVGIAARWRKADRRPLRWRGEVTRVDMRRAYWRYCNAWAVGHHGDCSTRAADREDTPMLSKLDLALVVACLASGAMALENHGRVDMSSDPRGVMLPPPIVCRPVTPSGLSLPNALDIAVQVPFDPTLVEFAIECQPA